MEPRQRPRARERAHQRPAADSHVSARGHERTDVARLELCQCRQGDSSAEVLGQEGHELPRVALIGLDRPGRQPALGAELRKPARERVHDVRIRKRQLSFRRAAHMSVRRGWVCLPVSSRPCAGALTLAPLSHPAGSLRLNCADSVGPPQWQSAWSTFWCRSRSTAPIRIACRKASRSPPAISSAFRSARVSTPGWCGARAAPGPGSTTALRTSPGHSTSRRCGRSCGASSTGPPATRSARAAWSCAWRFAWASNSARSASGWACGSPDLRRRA